MTEDAGTESRFLQLPLPAIDCIWNSLSLEDCNSLYAISKGVQALFAPVVSDLYVDVSSSGASPNPLSGLHPAVRLTSLRLEGVSDAALPRLHALVNSHQCSFITALTIPQATLTPAITRTLQPLFPNLIELDISDCTVQPGSAEHLVACSKLQELVVTGRRVMPGAEQGFSVLAGLPSLSLKVEGVELGEIPVDEIGTSHVHLLKALGPSLTSLQYHFSTVGAEEEFRAFLELAKEGHLQKVTSIKFVCRPVIEGVSEEQVATLARSCPLLQAELNQMELANLEAIRPLMAMPNLKELRCGWVQGRSSTARVRTPYINWPPRKLAMSIIFYTLSPTQLIALPFQHLSSVRVDYLTVGTSQESSREEQTSVMQAVLRDLVHKQVQVEVKGMMCLQRNYNELVHAPGGGLQALASFAAPAATAPPSPQQPPSPPPPAVSLSGSAAAPPAQKLPPVPLIEGQAAAGPQCPLVLSDREEATLLDMQLDAGDIHGVAAAWGSRVWCLRLVNCSLASQAWAAITADRFSKLLFLELDYGGGLTGTELPLGADLMAMLMKWPQSRPLYIQVPATYPDREHIKRDVQACQAALSAHGMGHITLAWQ